MEIVTMGKVVVSARIENLRDMHEVDAGVLPPDQARSVEVTDALVDTGATMLSMPGKLIEQLGLARRCTRKSRTTEGTVEFAVCDAVRLTVQGRDCVAEVAELPDEYPILIGRIPLVALDLVVDQTGQKLIGNPDHGGKQMIDMF